MIEMKKEYKGFVIGALVPIFLLFFAFGSNNEFLAMLLLFSALPFLFFLESIGVYRWFESSFDTAVPLVIVSSIYLIIFYGLIGYASVRIYLRLKS